MKDETDLRTTDQAGSVTRLLAEAAGLLRTGQPIVAKRRLMSWYIKGGPADAGVDYLLGVAAFRSEDPRTAEGAFRRCVAARPNDSAAHYGLGTALLALGDREGALSAFAAALQADPGMAEAKRQLARLPMIEDGGAGTAEKKLGHRADAIAPTESMPAATPAESLADLLDRRERQIPGADELTGGIVWTGRSAFRSVIVPILAPFLLLIVPPLVHEVASGLPASAQRHSVASLWRIASAWALPLAVVLALVVLTNWLMREFVLKERRLEVWTGLLRRRHLVLWLHDIERPAMVRQRLWHIVLDLGTLELSSTILPQARGRRMTGRLGHLRLLGLPIHVAETLAAVIWQRSLWERRRMVQTFVSSR